MADEIQLSDLHPQTVEVKKVESLVQIPTKSSPDSPQDVKSTPTANEAAIADTPSDVEYPTGIRFAILTVSLMLMVFMVALDTTIMGKFQILLPSKCLSHRSVMKTILAHSNYSNRNPSNNNSIPLHLRHWMVYWRLSLTYHGLTAVFWEDLHVLLDQICVTLCSTSFRDGFFDLCPLA